MKEINTYCKKLRELNDELIAIMDAAFDLKSLANLPRPLDKRMRKAIRESEELKWE